MDTRGAQELAKVLQQRKASPKKRELVADDAPPIFHWLGVQPPNVERVPSVDEIEEAPPASRSRRRTRRR